MSSGFIFHIETPFQPGLITDIRFKVSYFTAFKKKIQIPVMDDPL